MPNVYISGLCGTSFVLALVNGGGGAAAAFPFACALQPSPAA